MNRKIRNIFLFLSVFTVCLLVASVLQERATEATRAEEGAYLYELRSYEGRIALFSSGSDAPLHVFDKETATLPPADREALGRGIRLASAEELRRCLEDYF